MTESMKAAMAAANEGPLVKGRAGWLLDGQVQGFSTRTIEALVDRHFMTIEGRADKWGAKAIITDAGRSSLEVAA